MCRLVIIKDVTDLLRTENLKSIEKLTELMIASTSHDMRTPLNTIINMLLLIERQVADNSMML